jgi:hypothetical protein
MIPLLSLQRLDWTKNFSGFGAGLPFDMTCISKAPSQNTVNEAKNSPLRRLLILTSTGLCIVGLSNDLTSAIIVSSLSERELFAASKHLIFALWVSPCLTPERLVIYRVLGEHSDGVTTSMSGVPVDVEKLITLLLKI